jgi:4-amino-4-deoxy-L-arabinose transferase-like glycosyltransferase
VLSRPYRYLFPAVIALVIGFRLATILLARPVRELDEAIHLGVAQLFGAGLPSLARLRDYPSATGPFFYVLFGNLGALVKFDLTALRLAVLTMASGSIVLYYRIVRRALPGQSPPAAVALLVTAPYFGALAGAFMTEHLALLLVLAALLCYLRFRTQSRLLDAVLALVFSTLAVYTRVYCAFLPLAFAAADLFHRDDSSLLTPRSSPLSAVIWLLPIAAFLPMVLLWHGFTPPSYHEIYRPGFQWKNAASVLVWTGVVFLPWAWRRLRPWHLLALLAIPPVLLAGSLGLGITKTALGLLPRPLALAISCGFGTIGLLWLVQLITMTGGRNPAYSGSSRLPAPWSISTRVAAIAALLLATGLIVSGPQVYERYLLPGIPLALICARPASRPGLALAWAGLIQLPLALIHTLHLLA